MASIRLGIPSAAGPPVLWLALWLLAVSPVGADVEQIKTQGRLRAVAVRAMAETSALSGRAAFDLEILEGFARLHGLPLETVSVPAWSDLIPALLAGKADLIAGGMTVSDERRKQIEFTTETLPTRSVVISRKPRPPITTLEQLAAVQIGTLAGSAQIGQLRAAGVPPSHIVQFVRSTAMRQSLQSGQIAAQVVPLESALVSMTLDGDLQLGLYVGGPGSLAYGVRRQDPRLRDALSEYLSNFRRTPSWNRLLIKHFGESAIDILKRARAE